LRLYLVRHGETAWSLSGQHTGRTDLPLTARGEEAAHQLGLRLRDVAFSRVWTSPLLRARQTCELARLKPRPELENALVEWDNGDYEGVTRADVHQARPGWSLFRDGAPGGETPEQISYRVDGLITRLRLLDGNVAIFSHGHLGRALAARWIGLPVEQGQHLLLGTASLSILCFEHDHTDEPAIELWNSLADARDGER
jgi:probable phosphoglycerate mutase